MQHNNAQERSAVGEEYMSDPARDAIDSAGYAGSSQFEVVDICTKKVSQGDRMQYME
jgi:hypothetical protein